jgi:hypothetical protein
MPRERNGERKILNISKDSFGGDIIVRMRDPRGYEENVSFFDVRGGLVWPTISSPGYYCIIGQEEIKRSTGKRPVVFFREGEDDLLEGLFRKLTDDAKKCFVSAFYCDRAEEHLSFIEDFEDFLKRNFVGDLMLIQAPDVQNFQYGVNLIRQYRKEQLLEIPEQSTLYGQLRALNPDDVKHSREDKLYAVNGLRYAIVGFEKSQPAPPMGRRIIKPPPRSSWKGWV